MENCILNKNKTLKNKFGLFEEDKSLSRRWVNLHTYKKNIILSSLIFTILGCQVLPTVNNTTESTNISSETADYGQIQFVASPSDEDEKAIYEIIKNNPDFFPTDINSDDSNQATVLPYQTMVE